MFTGHREKKILLSRYNILIAAVLIAVLSFTSGSFARPVSSDEAMDAVAGWLNSSDRLFDLDISKPNHFRVEAFPDSADPEFYVVQLQPQGFVIVSPDDLIDPVIAFSPTGRYVHDAAANPLTEMLASDMKTLLKDARNSDIKTAGKGRNNGKQLGKLKNRHEKARNKWNRYKQNAGPKLRTAKASELPSEVQDLAFAETLAAAGEEEYDICVPPLVQSKWNQAGGIYNRFTPNNHVCGCVATAFAQILRYFEYPVEAPDGSAGPFSYTYEDKDADGNITRQSGSGTLLGGDGSGGPYDWTKMPYRPGSGTPEDEKDMIGRLCYDCGITVHMGYGYGGSGAYTGHIRSALVNQFLYAQAKYDFVSNADKFNRIVNSNLDAGLPMVLSIFGSGGHAVVCDGYSYNNDTLYHHINMGWGGGADAWYAFPNFGSFTSVSECINNIFTEGTGNIISGRAVDLMGTPIAGVNVTATQLDAPADQEPVIMTATTNEYGVYAFAKINGKFKIEAKGAGHNFQPYDGSEAPDCSSGNVWGIDFGSSGIASQWTTQQILTEDHEDAALESIDEGDIFGTSVDVDGKYIVVGAPEDALEIETADPENPEQNITTTTRTGFVYVFRQSSDNDQWERITRFNAGDTAAEGDEFGSAVAVSGDYIAIGAPAINTAYIFKRDAVTYDLVETITGPAASQFGKCIDIDQTNVIIGSIAKAYIYTRTFDTTGEEQWTLKQTLTVEEDTAFGKSVSIKGIVAAVGSANKAYAFFNDSGIVPQGEHVPTGTWVLSSTLTNTSDPNHSDTDNFGCSVDVSGTDVIVGASGLLGGTGGVYAFAFTPAVEDGTGIITGINWQPAAVLMAEEGSEGDRFGSSVAVSGQILAIAAEEFDEIIEPEEPAEGEEAGEPTITADIGSVYIFRFDSLTNLWSQQAMLKAQTPSAGMKFAGDLAIFGSTLVTGFAGDTVKEIPNAGSAYVFVNRNGLPEHNADVRNTRDVTHKYEYLQAAIDAAAAGETLIVDGGSIMVENITIDKPLKIRSIDFGQLDFENWDDTQLSGKDLLPKITFIYAATPGPSAITVAPPVGSAAFDLQISGFTITNGKKMVVDPDDPDTVLEGNGGGIEFKSMMTTSDPNTATATAYTPKINNCIISGNYALWAGGAMFMWEKANAQITGCDINNNSAKTASGGIYAHMAKPTIKNTLITDNRGGNWSGAISSNTGSVTTITNCTIANNFAGDLNCGLECLGGKAIFKNSILWANTSPQIKIESYTAGEHTYEASAEVSYCDIFNTDPNGVVIADQPWPGTGNINADPNFAKPELGDYHLKSKDGRYDPGFGRNGDFNEDKFIDTADLLGFINVWLDTTQGSMGDLNYDNIVNFQDFALLADMWLTVPDETGDWLSDSITSPCIDAGDPTQLDPDGTTINMGAYGGTDQASR